MLRQSVRFLNRAEWLCCCYKIKPHFKMTSVLYSTFDKDFPNPSLPTPVSKLHSHDQDILLEQIRKTKSPERLLELISMHVNVMNAKHIVESMQIFFDLSKNPGFKSENLIENTTFQSLCSRLMKNVRLLDPQEVITVFKFLSTLGIRNNTYVMQSILKMMGAHLNNMTLGQLIFLNFLLNKQKNNSLVDGLKLALPLVLQVQIEQQLDTDNLDEIINCLQLACRSRLKPSIIEKVFAAVLRKAKLFSTSNAVSTTFALLNLETPVDGYKTLINYCFEVLSKDAGSLNQKQTLSIIRLCRNRGHYDSRFLFSVMDKIISEKWSFEPTYGVISYFYRMKFAPQPLMDHFVDLICSESDIIRTKLDYSPLNCVEYFTLTGYHPHNVKEAIETLCSCDNKISEMASKTPNLLLKFISHITMLGYFPSEILEKCLNEDFLFNAWSLSRKQGRNFDFESTLANLIFSLKTYDQSDSHPVPPVVFRKFLSNQSQKHENHESPLKSFIQHGLGGTQFFQSSLLTNEGIFVDHALIMRSGNYPVSLEPSQQNQSHPLMSSSTKFVEDLFLPEDAKVVTIIVADQDNYCRNPEVPIGSLDLKIKCLLKKKYCPVVINIAHFNNMPDREKIPFLMKEIKEAVEENAVSKFSF